MGGGVQLKRQEARGTTIVGRPTLLVPVLRVCRRGCVCFPDLGRAFVHPNGPNSGGFSCAYPGFS